jgi:hypothetical protein
LFLGKRKVYSYVSIVEFSVGLFRKFSFSYFREKLFLLFVSWRGEELGNLWKDDPVHPSEAAYQKMAASAMMTLTGMESGARKRARTNSIETAVPGPRPPPNNRDSREGRGLDGARGGGGRGGAVTAIRGGRRGGR